MDNTIKHEGIVERIENGIAYVKADQQEKIIETVCSGCNIKIGERVFIVGNETMSRKALKLAIIYPFFCLFGILCIAYAFSVNELLSGILSIIALIPYYTVLYFRKSKLRKDFIFTLEKE